MRMIVFPLRRSVGLRAATASSRFRDVADVGPQASVSDPLDDFGQLRAVSLDHEVDRQAVGGSNFGRRDHGHQCSSGADQSHGPPLDVAADNVEDQIDTADVFQFIVLKIDELMRSEVKCLAAGRTRVRYR